MTTGTTEQRMNRKRRGKKKWLIAAVVLIGLLVAADFGAATAAEYQVSKKAREQFGLRDDPSVTIHGFPFLTQAISGTYDTVSISAAGIPVGETLRELEINATLHRVHAPLNDLISGNTQSIKVDKVDGEVKIKATDVGRAVRLPDLQISPTSEHRVRNPEGEDNGQQQQATQDEAQDDATAGIRLDATKKIAGEDTKISVFAMLALSGNSVEVQPQRVELRNEAADIVVPQQIQQSLFSQFSVDLQPGQLPFKVTPTAVAVEDNALMLQGEASNVALSGE